jgi:aspartate/methionine/tyrosine aminotransferase
MYVNGCNSAIEHLSWATADPGDVFLLGQPYYKSFIPDISARFGTEIIEASFHNTHPLSLDAVSVYEKRIMAAESEGKRVAALLISHPHNPLGRCYPREVLIELMRLCDRHSMHFICDEIYALSTFANKVDGGTEPVPFESVLSIDTKDVIDPSLVHVLWGVSKDFGASGFRLGFIISQANRALQAAILPVSIYTSTSSLSEHVMANALRDDAWVDGYIEENQSKLAESHEYVTTWARSHGIEYAPGVNSAFFLWVNLGEAYKTNRSNETNGHSIDSSSSKTNGNSVDSSIDEVVMKALLQQKVFLGAGDGFGSERPGWFRIVFTQRRDFLDAGLRRTLAAVGCCDSAQAP